MSVQIVQYAESRPWVSGLALGCLLLGSWPCHAASTARPAPDAETTLTSYQLPTDGPLSASQIGDGVWWTPELDATSVTETLDYLADVGIPNIYVDVFSEGRTLMPSQAFPQMAGSENRDWLNFIITEAHSRNIRVHAWMQMLNWGSVTEDKSTHPLLIEYPHWMDESLTGEVVDDKTSSVYVSPGVADVQEWLDGVLEEVCAYPVDGICLDALSYNPNMDTGYNFTPRQDFRLKEGFDPASVSPDLGRNSDWMKWVAQREDTLTSLAQQLTGRIRDTATSRGRRILVSVVVRPEYEENHGRDTSYQDWKHWLELNLPDVTIPQCFSPQLPGLEQELWAARSTQVGSRVACIPGLALATRGEDTRPPLADQKRILKGAGFQHFTVLDFTAFRQARENSRPERKVKAFWEIFNKED